MLADAAALPVNIEQNIVAVKLYAVYGQGIRAYECEAYGDEENFGSPRP